LAAIPKGASFDFLKDGYSEQRNVRLETGDSNNEIRLSAGGAIRGVVVDQAGKAVRSFNVRVTIPRHLESGEQAGGYYAGFDWYGVTYTRDDGVFVLTDIGANHWMRLIVSSPKIGVAIIDRVKSDSLDHLSPAEKLTIRLKPFTPFRVKVVDQTELRPVANAWVILLEDEADFTHGFNWGYHDSSTVRMQTDRQGIVRFDEPAGEDGTIIVRAKGFARQRVSGAFDVPLRTIPLERAAELHGEVRLNNQLLADGFVRLTSNSNDSFVQSLDDTKGRFDFDELPDGEYTLAVNNRRGQSVNSRKVKLDSGKTQSLSVNVSGGSGSR
jgi:hypothetical protein